MANKKRRYVINTLVIIFIFEVTGVYSTPSIAQTPSHKISAQELQPLMEQGKKGEVNAQYLLGFYFATGLIDSTPPDYEKALYWFRKAATQGDAGSQKWLGAMYHTGEGVPKDYTEAMKWYRKAAEQGNAEAQFQLGSAYHAGIGVPQNYTESVKWLRKAAEQGDTDAQINLGIAYYNGQGVERDYGISYAWLSLPATEDNEDAIKVRDELSKVLKSDDLLRAQAISKKFLVEYTKKPSNVIP